MSTTPSFLLFVQRKSGEGDDVIKISRANIDTSRFKVSYTDETSAIAPRVMYLSESEVMDYVGTIVNGLALDKDPFDHFQITPPAAPSIQFDIADLSNASVQQAIYGSLQFAIRHWVTEDVPVRRRSALNPEDDSEEEFQTPPARRRRTVY
jgi:hypothetical protein